MKKLLSLTALALFSFFSVFSTAEASKITMTNDFLNVSFNEQDSGSSQSAQWYYNPAGNGSTGQYNNYHEHFAVWHGGAIHESDGFPILQTFQASGDGKTAVLDAGGGIQVTRKIHVPTGHNPYFTMTYIVKNTGAAAMSDVRFFESIDYDIAGAGHDYGWYSAATDTVWQDDTNAYKNGFGGDVSSTRHGMGGYYFQNYSDWDDGNLNSVAGYPSTDGSVTDDVAVGLQWNIGTLQPGQTWSNTLTWSFGELSGGGLQAVMSASATTIYAGDSVNFNAGASSCSGGACPITSYDWDMSGNGVFNDASGVNASQTFNTLGDYTISVQVTGTDGSVSVDRSVVHVVNPPNTPPTLTLLGAAALNHEAGDSYNDAGASAADNEDDNATLTAAITVSGSVDNMVIAPQALTYNVTDSGGLSASPVSRTVNVVDTTAPVLTVPGDVSAEANGDPNSTVVIGSADATDIFTVTITNDAPTAGFPLGTTTVNWTATDANGNSTTLQQSVTVSDTTAPVLTVPGDVSVEANAVLSTVAIGTATATDIFAVTVASDAPATYALGTTVVTWTATDANGNVTTGTQNVTVVDTTAPVLTVPADVSVEANGVLSTVNIGTASATDIFGATVTNDAPATYPVGTTVVTYTATDGNGLITTGGQNVTVVDTTAPTVTAQLIPLNIGDDDDEGKDGEHGDKHHAKKGLFKVVFTATDIADPNLTVVATLNGETVTNGQIVELKRSKKSKSEFEHGKLEVKGMSFSLDVAATDASGNVGTAAAAYAFPVKHEKHESKKDDKKSDKKSKKHDKDD